MTQPEMDPILWRHLRELPYFRAMLRAVEDSFYQAIDLPRPVLDVGCGDGHFASVAFSQPLEVGIDPWAAPLIEARLRQVYRLLLQGDGAHMPFPDSYFASAISNSVLEHIPSVDVVLQETARVLRPGGKFIFCVPNQRFNDLLLGATLFRRLGWAATSRWYTRLFNRISRHAHCDSQAVWQARLDQAGFIIDRCWDYFPAPALHVLEVGHALGLPSLLVRRLTGRWILSPTRINLIFTWLITRQHVEQAVSEQGAYSFYIASRRG
jgi:SAM-dependent methyltransferase